MIIPPEIEAIAAEVLERYGREGLFQLAYAAIGLTTEAEAEAEAGAEA